MKKRMVAFVTACCLVFPLISFVGCKGDDTPSNGTEKDNVVCSFESVEEIVTLNSGDVFGMKQYSQDENYVTHGNGCMYLEIQATFDYVARENIWGLDFKEEFIEPHLKFEATKFNFTDVEGVYGFALDVYNASGKDVPVELTMEADVDSAGSYFDMGSQTVLKDKKTTLYFTADVETLIYQGINDLTSVIVTFPYTDGDEAPIKLYVDNFRMIRGKTGIPTAHSIEGQTLCGFENRDALTRVTASSFYTVKDYWAKRDLNYDGEFITEGNASLKLTRGYSNYVTKGRSGKNVVTFSNANFFKGGEIGALSTEDLERLVIKVDVYNDSEKDETFEWFVGPRRKESICLFKVQGVPAKTWTTLELSVAERLAYNKQIAEEQGREYIQIDLRELFTNFAFHFSFMENHTNSVITTYVDNLRYELEQ